MIKPIENSYWVIEGRFLAGEYPGTPDKDIAVDKLKAFLDVGIDCFINLTYEYEPLERYDLLVKNLTQNNDIHLKRFPIVDASVPESKEYTTEILDFIDEMLEKNHKIYIHCWGGIGRTGTMVGCWLSRHGYIGEKGLAKLKELWKSCKKSGRCNSPETTEQENYILDW